MSFDYTEGLGVGVGVGVAQGLSGHPIIYVHEVPSSRPITVTVILLTPEGLQKVKVPLPETEPVSMNVCPPPSTCTLNESGMVYASYENTTCP